MGGMTTHKGSLKAIKNRGLGVALDAGCLAEEGIAPNEGYLIAVGNGEG